MINLKFIPSKGNSPTKVYNTVKFNKYRLTIQCELTESNIYYDGFLSDLNQSIISRDWCIVTNPYDGEEYTEQCKKITLENNREIFYGMDGTRCLLIDATKIIGTTNTTLEEVKQISITEEMLKEHNSKPFSFMEEDLWE